MEDATRTGERVVIDMGGRLVRRLVVAGAVILALGATLVGYAVSGEVGAEEGGGAVAILAGLGVAIALFGLFCFYGAYRGLGVRVVIDERGIAREARSRAWRIAWADLDAVGVSVLRWMPPRATTMIGRGERMGRIVLAPTRELPGLRGLRAGDEPEPWTTYLTLGSNADWTAAAEDGLRRFAGERYAGVHERDVLRRRYS